MTYTEDRELSANPGSTSTIASARAPDSVASGVSNGKTVSLSAKAPVGESVVSSNNASISASIGEKTEALATISVAEKNNGLLANNAASKMLSKVIQTRFAQVLDAFEQGQLSCTWPDGETTVHGQLSNDASYNASVILHSYAPIKRLVTDGQIGFAESYMAKEWSTDNLRNLFMLIMRNEQRITPLTAGNTVARMYNKLNHKLKRNNKRGSERNIAYHYDLGNDFYKLWLDASMSYSSALFESPDQSLCVAQHNKMQTIIDMLAPKSSSSVLEIGCGWGGLARQLNAQTGCNVMGVSLSKQQLAYANSDLSQQPETVQESLRFEYCDYRELNGKFDHVVSIEMFEAVGQEYWSVYFDKVNEVLNSGGTAVLQIITLLEDRFERYCKKPDFIQRYIFPGGMLPTKSLLLEYIDNAGFEVEKSHWFGNSYAQTLSRWLDNFEAASREVLALNYDERFLRMWRYYLVYCYTGFHIGNTDVGLLKIRKR